MLKFKSFLKAKYEVSDFYIDSITERAENGEEFAISVLADWENAYDDAWREGAKLMNYWDNVTRIYAKQRAKGLAEYGLTLEQNTSLDIIKRIEMCQEEIIDTLVYLEHIKEGIRGELDDGK